MKNSSAMEYITFEQLPTAFVHLYRKVENIERLLQQKVEPQPEVDQLMTIQEASEFLKLAVPTLYGLVSRSGVPVSKKSKRLYFSKQELTDWVKAGRKKTQAEIQAQAKKFIDQRKGR